MPHKLSDAEGQALASLALALRPDWQPNNPGKIIHDHQQQHGALTEAADFPHAVRAMLAYATAAGANRKRTPNLYIASGKHWMGTLPRAESDAGLPPRELWCPEHDSPESTCRNQHTRTEPPTGWRTQPAEAVPTGAASFIPQENE